MSDEYTREELISLCERAVVPEKDWCNRDSANSQLSVGQTLVLLKCGCDFKILRDPDEPTCTNEHTIWIEFSYNGFEEFELGTKDNVIHYIPTEEKLKKADGKDWY